MTKLLLLLLCSTLCSGQTILAASWSDDLKAEITAIDAATPGNIGIYIKRLKDGSTLEYRAHRKWYLASTIKIPVAVALLQKVDENQISLSKVLTLKRSDYVDGSGDLLWKDPGAQVTVGELLEKMLTQSDSTAADMLIRLIGVEDLNSRIQSKMGISGFNPITSLLQVRLDAYSELHPKARELTNMDFIELKKVKSPSQRRRALAGKIGVPPQNLKAATLTQAFERYYERGLNSGTLEAFGRLLEKIAEGKLLSEKSTALLLKHMENMQTGENRLKAGFPDDIRFAQKTGTQLRRMCNMGILKRPAAEGDTYVVAACLEKFSSQESAERTLQKIGQAFSRNRFKQKANAEPAAKQARRS